MLHLERKKNGLQYDEQHFAIGAWIQPPPWLLFPTCKGTQRCTLNRQSIFAKTSLPSVSDNLFSSSANSYPWDHAPQYFGNSNMGSVKDKRQSLLINPFRGISCLTLELFGFFLCSQVTLLAGLDIGYWSASCSSLTKTRAKRLAPTWECKASEDSLFLFTFLYKSWHRVPYHALKQNLSSYTVF